MEGTNTYNLKAITEHHPTLLTTQRNWKFNSASFVSLFKFLENIYAKRVFTFLNKATIRRNVCRQIGIS